MQPQPNQKIYEMPDPGKLSAASGRAPKDLSAFFAKEGVCALSHAFDAKIAMHPGTGGNMIEPESIQSHMDLLLASPLRGKTVAYIHVPFCQTHCLYCGFYNKAYHESDSRLYADALLAELQMWRERKAVQSTPVHAVYFGGGTPTALEAEDLQRILEGVREALTLANDCEITVEGRLTNFGPRKMEACLEGGANRFSLGVQSFHTSIRQSMGRLGSRDDMERGLEQLLSYDQAAVIVDLIYGFPNQTLELWREDIAVAQSLNLDGADCYQLNVYRQTPLGRGIEQGKIAPTADIPLQSAMYAAAVEDMGGAFYRRLSLSHWARTSRERNLYNLYVKASANCLAFGPGAGGNLGGHFYMNNSNYAEWQQAVRDGRKPLAFVQSPQRHYFLYRSVAECMEQGWMDVKGLERRFALPLGQIWEPVLAQWQRAQLLEWHDGRVVLTMAGQFWQVNLTQLLLNFLKAMLEEKNVAAA